MNEYEQETQDLIATFKEIYKSPLMQQFIMNAYGEMSVLSSLKHHPDDGLMPSSIGQKTALSPARVAAILKSLEKKGFISRDINLQDRRKIWVKITPTGLAKQANERDRTFAVIETIFAQMGQSQVKQLIDSIQLFQKVSTQVSNNFTKISTKED